MWPAGNQENVKIVSFFVHVWAFVPKSTWAPGQELQFCRVPAHRFPHTWPRHPRRPGCSPPAARAAMEAAAAAAAPMSLLAAGTERDSTTEEGSESDHLIGDAHLRAGLKGFSA